MANALTLLRARPAAHAFVLVLAVGLANAAAHFALFAPWMGEDEPWHLEYATHVGRGNLPSFLSGATLTRADLEHHGLTQLQVHRRFPELPWDAIEAEQRAILASMQAERFWRRVDWLSPNSSATTFDEVAASFTATSQPPLYYLTSGAWLGLGGARTALGRLYQARALSFVLHAATLVLGLVLIGLVFEPGWTRLAAGLVLALWPGLAREAALVNNDVLASALATALLACAALALRPGGPGGRWSLLVVPALALAAFLTKMTAAAAALIALAVHVARRLRGGSARRWLLAGGALALVAAAVLAYWHVQHNPAVPRTLDALRQRAATGLSIANRDLLFAKLAGRFNWNARPAAAWVEETLFVCGYVTVILALLASLRPRADTRRAAWLLCLAATACQLALIVLRGVAEARYLMPVAAPLAVLVAGALVGGWRVERRPLAALLVVAAFVLWNGTYLWRGLLLHHYLAWNA